MQVSTGEISQNIAVYASVSPAMFGIVDDGGNDVEK